MDNYCKINGQKGGRPLYNVNTRIELPDFKMIILTPAQYGTLLEKYGYSLLYSALSILENWLQHSPEAEKYRGKNNYGHFRSDGWVINTEIYNLKKTENN